MSTRRWSDEQLIEAVKTSKTLLEVASKLGLATYGANSRTIKKRIIHLNLNTSHFLSSEEKLKKARSFILPTAHSDLFTINKIDRKHIKRIIIKNDLIPYQCALCPVINTWQDMILSLHLDHINGINNDNRLENLRFLCPNCHSQTSSYCGKQLKTAKSNDHYCLDCKTSIHRNSNRCRSCAAKKQKTKINWSIDVSILIKMVDELGYQKVGKQLGVSGNAVKKRIRILKDTPTND